MAQLKASGAWLTPGMVIRTELSVGAGSAVSDSELPWPAPSRNEHEIAPSGDGVGGVADMLAAAHTIKAGKGWTRVGWARRDTCVLRVKKHGEANHQIAPAPDVSQTTKAHTDGQANQRQKQGIGAVKEATAAANTSTVSPHGFWSVADDSKESTQ